MKRLTIIAAVFLFAACSVKTPAPEGDLHLNVFEKEAVRWNPDSLGTYSPEDETGIIHLAAGRMILRKVTLPDYGREVKATLTVRVESAGDRWDKSGSVFVIPADSKINLLSVAKRENAFPEVDSLKYEKLIGTVPGPDFEPTLELMRFMTPFGVGFYSRLDTAEVSRTRPVYVDGWAPEVRWEADITPLYPELRDSYVGVFIDTWTEEGYIASVDIDIEETEAPMKERHVIPLVNTLYYIGQEYPDIFARRDLTVDFNLDEYAPGAVLRYIVTGHGGHEGGDEFTPQRNVISLDKEVVKDYVPWRTDCASFRRFNPTSGIWAVRREASFYGEKGREVKMIDEMLASSDLSRSNWCPGSMVEPEDIPLGDLAAGAHRITFSIPGAQPIDGDKMNHWLISAYIVY